jgi:serine/threonine protein phosphatase 1
MIELSQAPARLPPGRRIYAVSDIHGCARQLANLHEAIAADLAARPVTSPLLLHIGDYVDRGIDSAGVIERLVDGCPIRGADMVNLLGNHESTIMEALSGNAPRAPTGCSPAAEPRWKVMGSTRTGHARPGGT